MFLLSYKVKESFERTIQYPLLLKDDCGLRSRFIIYKLPKYKIGEVGSGVEYMYLDSSVGSWQMSKFMVNTSQGAIGSTLNQLYMGKAFKSNSSVYALYNDAPPNLDYLQGYGHTKGSLLFDRSQGFWLSHSIPHFPSFPEQGYIYPTSGKVNGQTALCVTYQYEQFKRIAKQMAYLYPRFYNCSVPAAFSGDLPQLAQLCEGTKPPLASDKRVEQLFSIEGEKFASFVKSEHFVDDIYTGWVAQALDADLLVESWQTQGYELPSNCSLPKHTLNIERIQLPGSVLFQSHYDHSKWCVSQAYEDQRTIIRFLLSVGILFQGCDSDVKCKNDNGDMVDWYILYKMPSVNGGLTYLYMDQSTNGWKLSNKMINSESGTLANTLKPLFDYYDRKTEGFGYMLYNDQPPEPYVAPASFGHSKGVVMLDKQTGVWLSHSTPKFPTYRRKDFWPSSGSQNGQTFMCVTYSYSEFKQIDLYSGLIVNHMTHNLYVKSWGKMRRPLPSNCSTSIPHHVYNVKEVKLLNMQPFNNTVDHSKWCVTSDGGWTCIADMNREWWRGSKCARMILGAMLSGHYAPGRVSHGKQVLGDGPD
ncbi:hypothetical protein L3Q82_007973 [Scortum barcoo]|uniref:Uncharacterized protein n=1 Tax=Scortum barcoo TaxID=214431 RepID=A0ACB8WKL2_9TELE|nr:hypothetical protein L3Q82_007973 [Scortum barcoo]